MWLIVNPFFERRKIFEKISKIFQNLFLSSSVINETDAVLSRKRIIG